MKNKDFINSRTLYFAKCKREAIIPSKDEFDVGYDVYAYFDEDEVIIQPFESKLISTGIKSAFSNDYGLIFKERGSTGINNIEVRAGVIEGSFRGEWFVCLYNGNKKPLVITKEFDSVKEKDLNKEQVEDLEVLKDSYIVYPYKKAICQAVFVELPRLKKKEISEDELMSFESKRGESCLGSSGK